MALVIPQSSLGCGGFDGCSYLFTGCFDCLCHEGEVLQHTCVYHPDKEVPAQDGYALTCVPSAPRCKSFADPCKQDGTTALPPVCPRTASDGMFPSAQQHAWNSVTEHVGPKECANNLILKCATTTACYDSQGSLMLPLACDSPQVVVLVANRPAQAPQQGRQVMTTTCLCENVPSTPNVTAAPSPAPQCPTGRYKLQSSCQGCPKGYFCEGDNEKRSCPDGKYTNGFMAPACLQCPVGKNSDTYPRTHCTSASPTPSPKDTTKQGLGAHKGTDPRCEATNPGAATPLTNRYWETCGSEVTPTCQYPAVEPKDNTCIPRCACPDHLPYWRPFVLAEGANGAMQQGSAPGECVRAAGCAFQTLSPTPPPTLHGIHPSPSGTNAPTSMPTTIEMRNNTRVNERNPNNPNAPGATKDATAFASPASSSQKAFTWDSSGPPVLAVLADLRLPGVAPDCAFQAFALRRLRDAFAVSFLDTTLPADIIRILELPDPASGPNTIGASFIMGIRVSDGVQHPIGDDDMVQGWEPPSELRASSIAQRFVDELQMSASGAHNDEEAILDSEGVGTADARVMHLMGIDLAAGPYCPSDAATIMSETPNRVNSSASVVSEDSVRAERGSVRVLPVSMVPWIMLPFGHKETLEINDKPVAEVLPNNGKISHETVAEVSQPDNTVRDIAIIASAASLMAIVLVAVWLYMRKAEQHLQLLRNRENESIGEVGSLLNHEEVGPTAGENPLYNPGGRERRPRGESVNVDAI